MVTEVFVLSPGVVWSQRCLCCRQVVDSDGASSDPFILMVMIKPMNTLAPVVTTNTGLQLFEGQSRPLRADRNLQVSDENNLQDVRVSAVRSYEGGGGGGGGLLVSHFD